MCRIGYPYGPVLHHRLHGTRRTEIEKKTAGTWNKIREPKDDGLRATAEITRQNVEAGVDAYAKVNNYYKGSAPLTVRRLAEVL